MRKIIAAAFVSIDGVMQAPGGPEEDRSGGFEFGGWLVPHFDETGGGAVGRILERGDLLLGRKTYDIFAAYWPHFPTDPDAEGYDEGSAGIAKLFDRITKYVASRSERDLKWQNSEWLGPDTAGALRRLKQEGGPDLFTQGSSDLLQTLFAEDLIDELHLLTFPILLGRGKKMFGDGVIPAGFRLIESSVTPKGVVITSYARTGKVETGSFAADNPSEEELARRATIEG